MARRRAAVIDSRPTRCRETGAWTCVSCGASRCCDFSWRCRGGCAGPTRRCGRSPCSRPVRSRSARSTGRCCCTWMASCASRMRTNAASTWSRDASRCWWHSDGRPNRGPESGLPTCRHLPAVRRCDRPPVRPGSRHDTAAARYHRRARRRYRHHAPYPADWRVSTLASRAGMGTGGDGPARHRGGVRDVGRRRRNDDPQGPIGNALPQGHPLGQPHGEAAGSAGLDRAVGVQSSLFRSRGVRLGAPPGFSQGLEDSDIPGRDRDQRAGAVAVNPAPLGVFDSGIGGLTVARAVFERLPHESVIYFGDTARVPYGPKSPDTVRRYSGEILTYLLQRGVKALVVACNTISAQALDFLRERSPVPLVGVIEPGARAAVQGTRSGRIGVIGTAGTIASGAYERAIKQLRPDAAVCVQACPLFVPLVEEGWFDHSATELIAREYLAPLERAAVDVLVLGCTHYPLVKPLLARVLGPGVTLVDSAEETAKVVAEDLTQRGLAAAPNNRPTHRFVVSDDEPHFRRVGARFLGEKLQHVEVVPLG